MQARTSYGMFIPRFQDKMVARVEQRASRWVGVPVVHQEEIQVRQALHRAPGCVALFLDNNCCASTVVQERTTARCAFSSARVFRRRSRQLDRAVSDSSVLHRL